MLNIFVVILIASFWLAMNEAPKTSLHFHSVKINHVDDNLCIISCHFTETISAHALMRPHFIEIILTVDQTKKRLINSTEISDLKNDLIARLEEEGQAKNIIKTFFPDINEFYMATKNAMPRVTIWEKGGAHGSK